MPALVWDKPGERRYETGVDRGVIYLPSGSVVPWNGLTSVVESRSREVKSYYMDGVKYMDFAVPVPYSAKIQAFTYPEAMDFLLGNRNLAPGVVLYEQPARRFHLSYRTHIFNDLLGFDYGYKVHVVYNVTITSGDTEFDTWSDSPSGQPFEWTVSGIAAKAPDVRPSSHISLDSRFVDATLLESIETLLYGSPTSSPDLPSFEELIGMVT